MLQNFLFGGEGKEVHHYSAQLSELMLCFRDETAIRLTVDQQFFTCCILATADWCAETTMQLQEKLKQRVQVIIEVFFKKALLESWGLEDWFI